MSEDTSTPPQDVVLKAKLVNMLEEIKETMLPSEWEYMRECKRALIRGSIAGCMVGSLVSMAFSRTLFSNVPLLFRLPLSLAATSIFTVTGAMTVVPEMSRRGLFTLPDDSQIRMAIMHVVQLNNPRLNPQQMWSLLVKQKPNMFIKYILSDYPFGLPLLPPVDQQKRPYYNDPLFKNAMELISKGKLEHVSKDSLMAECRTQEEREVFQRVYDYTSIDDEFRVKLPEHSKGNQFSIPGLDLVFEYQQQQQSEGLSQPTSP